VPALALAPTESGKANAQLFGGLYYAAYPRCFEVSNIEQDLFR
jgi:hypothetical protein